MTLKYNQIKQAVDLEICQIEQKMVENIALIEPLNSTLKSFLSAPSKRIREVLPVLYLKSLGQELNTSQKDVLAVVELVHNASLIHDDIIDESTLRRGKKTISCEFDSKIGVISGDYLLAIALKKLCEISNIDIIEIFAQTIRNMCIGEVNQNFSRFKVGTIEDYIEKTKNKTAYLFEAAFLSCAILGNLDEDNSILMRNFGLNIGIAFQIKDDLMNMIDLEDFKPVHNDIANGIYNAPVILGNKEDNYATGIEKTMGLLNNYVEEAKKQLILLPKNKYKIAIENYLELLNNV